ncbi:hypothetical protein [Halarcobacter bivalviorum]|uniref:Uncharacterized protein n=1 Tax=Halarcobacter bivalviorum TaxID=663364 RepID=A0AAX2ADR1_9BACT|nr:hypothetical protein [Halarcobacter bivalviorum]AXH12167.1 hypothetical protein ABIV_1164 [Halarcobacter bivalviorum]RXK11273.1 hypothetical protein CRV05_02585 [Halarcobacter bivalviorum]
MIKILTIALLTVVVYFAYKKFRENQKQDKLHSLKYNLQRLHLKVIKRIEELIKIDGFVEKYYKEIFKHVQNDCINHPEQCDLLRKNPIHQILVRRIPDTEKKIFSKLSQNQIHYSKMTELENIYTHKQIKRLKKYLIANFLSEFKKCVHLKQCKVIDLLNYDIEHFFPDMVLKELKGSIKEMEEKALLLITQHSHQNSNDLTKYLEIFYHGHWIDN